MIEKKMKRPAGKIAAAVKKAAGKVKRAVVAPVTRAASKAASKPASKAGSPAAHPAVAPADFYRMVEAKAYEIHVRRGGGHGDHLADWYEAEMIVRSERADI